jgi:hypothetical protein
MSTTSNDSSTLKRKKMTRLRPEGAEQEVLDREKMQESNLSIDQAGCLPNLSCLASNTNNFTTLDARRRPISVMAANSFWSGVSEIKDVLTTNPLLEGSTMNETAKFYVNDSRGSTLDRPASENDHFFEDINTLYRRQTALFQRSCEQLKDLYHIQDHDEDDPQADANVSEFVLISSIRRPSSGDDITVTSVSDETIEGPIATVEGTITDDAKIFERTIRRSRIAFKSKIDILKAVTGKMIQMSSPSNAFGATDMVDVEDLYAEVIFSILHMIGNDSPDESMQFQLIEHLRKAFRVEPTKHMMLYEKAVSRDGPQLKLNLCVLEAKELATKDNLACNENVSKGDPFVTFHLKSKPFEMRNTGCKSRSIQPVWNETFVVDMSSEVDEEILHVDVWNFMPDENLREKLRKINDVRDSKGLRQFVMDTVSGNGNGNTNKLIGSVEIPLSTVPASGLNKWWGLEKLDKVQKFDAIIRFVVKNENLILGKKLQHFSF